MKKALLFSFLSFSFALKINAQNIQDGNIYFTGIVSTSPKIISFIATNDLPANEIVYFTDNALTETGTFRTGEGALRWTSPDSIIKTGTIIKITELVETPSQYEANYGAITKISSFSPATAGDQLLAYQTNASDTTFVAAINWGSGTSWITTGSPTAANSYLPVGLQSVLTFGVQRSNGAYNCPTTSIPLLDLKLQLVDITKWAIGNSTAISPCSTILVDTTVSGIFDSHVSQIQVFPNPCTGSELFFSRPLEQVVLTDVSGNKYFFEGQITAINISNLRSGLYLLTSNLGSQKILID